MDDVMETLNEEEKEPEVAIPDEDQEAATPETPAEEAE